MWRAPISAVLDKRIKAVRDALVDGFGVEPARVLQNAYEPIQFDEIGGYCGAQPTLGMDVHPTLKVNKARLNEAADVAAELQKRLECMASTRNRRDCPAGLATGAGTGFRFITDHVADFSKRGICARDPTRALIDQAAMKMPRRSKVSEDFEPYSPAGALPYGHRWRLIHNPNDAFLTANTHREGISPFDILQPAYAALTSGAFHPTAEGARDRRRPRDAPRARAARQGEEAGGRGAAELTRRRHARGTAGVRASTCTLSRLSWIVASFSRPIARCRYSRTIRDGGSLRFSPTKNATGSATLSMKHSYWPRIARRRARVEHRLVLLVAFDQVDQRVAAVIANST